jgi:hypothetical protein
VSIDTEPSSAAGSTPWFRARRDPIRREEVIGFAVEKRLVS